MNDWIEMGVWLVAATVGSRALPPRTTLRWTSRVAAWLATTQLTPPIASHKSEEAHTIASAISSHLPLSNCLDEAVAARLWLARRGVGVDVVVGMRRAGARWDGHAWFEHDGVAYGAGHLPHKVVFRESELHP